MYPLKLEFPRVGHIPIRLRLTEIVYDQGKFNYL